MTDQSTPDQAAPLDGDVEAAPTAYPAAEGDAPTQELDEQDFSNPEEHPKKLPAGSDRPQRGWVFRSVRLAALAVAISMAILIVIFAISQPNRGLLIGRSTVGQPAPDIEGETISGDLFDLDDHRGRWVVVNFFATWCTGCRVEHPQLVEFSSRHKAEGDAVVVTVAYDDDPQIVKDFFASEGGDWPVITEGASSVWIDYGVTAVPETYLVSPAGYVTDKLVGTYGVTADELDARISELEAAAENASDARNARS